MDEYEISSAVTYYVKDPKDTIWPQWRTNHPDAEWELLMGMSWECLEPPQELYEALKIYMGL